MRSGTQSWNLEAHGDMGEQLQGTFVILKIVAQHSTSSLTLGRVLFI